jgi:YbbR domain-containing protein
MMERLLNHPTWLKVFSVALAILLWAMVMPRVARETSMNFQVPLEVLYHPTFQIEEGPQDRQRTVTVEVSGKNLLVEKVKASMLHARINYSTVTEPGKQQQLEVQVTGELEGLKYAATPATLPVTLVVRSEADVPVEIDPPASRLVIQDGREWTFAVRPETESVHLSGRSDYLNQVKVARVVLDKNDLQPGVTSVVKTVIPTDAAGKTVDKLTLAQVNVILAWTEQPPGKGFTVEPKTIGTLASGFVVTNMEVDPPILEVRALTVDGQLPERAVLETEPIDLTGRRQPFTATVKVVSPPGATVAAQTVNVKVNISETAIEKVITGVALTVRGAAANAMVSPGTAEVQVTVRGPFTLVNPLDAQDFTAHLDVEGLASGKHTLPVKVSGPVGLTGLDANPVTVDVTISTP